MFVLSQYKNHLFLYHITTLDKTMTHPLSAQHGEATSSLCSSTAREAELAVAVLLPVSGFHKYTIYLSYIEGIAQVNIYTL